MKKAILLYSTMLFLGKDTMVKASPLQQVPVSYAKGPIALGENIPSMPATVKETPGNLSNEIFTPVERDTSFMQINTRIKLAAAKLKEKSKLAMEYVKANGFNPDYCFMVDMSVPSGKKRFFVYDLKNDSVEMSSLVAHGGGSYTPGCNDQLIFSNTPNSNATSLGRYKIGAGYKGTYGLSYKLYGLDSTNSNAFERAIVLHSDACVPECETYPRHIYQSLGCPIVPPSFLDTLGKYIKTSDKPILLWIYN